MTVSDLARHEAREVVIESYEVPGYNYRMSDILAAVGRVQLARLPEIVKRTRALAERYHELLGEAPGAVPVREPSWARSNWQSYAVRLPDGVDRRRVMTRMLASGVATRPGVMCAHLELPYRDSRHGDLGQSERARASTLLLPLFPELAREDQDRVIRALAEALRAEPLA
jgi:dTDP-4-amino-4,6-dideoxygalactose transaminase